jgi:dipeptidyl aminopeptidase/acylaminoacyl peptidase
MGVITCEISFTSTPSMSERDIFSERLAGNWGILDVSDCVLAVQQLSKTHIDGQRVFIRGGSAGGFTTLAAICTDPDVFAGATSLYGISDLRTLVKDTHKFESKYMDKLLGGTIQQIPKVYEDRSPVTHADKIKTPLLVSTMAIFAVFV